MSDQGSGSAAGTHPERSAERFGLGGPRDALARSLNVDTPVPVRLPKLVLDKTAALVGLVLAVGVGFFVAIGMLAEALVRPESRGPLLYRETRVSQGRPFRLIKFRILKTSGIRMIEEDGAVPKAVENAPENVTGVGRALKKTGFDELTQSWNVLRGEMSLVGPRPKPVAEYEPEIEAGIWRRKVARAGLTGPAQLLKGTERTAEDDLLADLEYNDACRRLSGMGVAWLDLRILGRTVLLMLKMTGE